MAGFFAALFAGRTDIYATRWENQRTPTAGARRGACGTPTEYLPLTAEVVTAHLSGELHLGLYPLLGGAAGGWPPTSTGTAMLDALSYWAHPGRDGSQTRQRPAARSHGATRRNGPSQLRPALPIPRPPSQDLLLDGGVGNVIAAPLQGRCRRDGATVFLDLAALEPHEDRVGVPVVIGRIIHPHDLRHLMPASHERARHALGNLFRPDAKESHSSD
jgi:hypothetical protein